MNERETYLKALYDLYALRDPSPSAKLLSSVSPHLSQAEIKSILDSVAQGKTVHFATPPLRVNEAFQIISANAALDGSGGYGMKRPAMLCWSYAGRLRGSCVYKFAEKAVEYAKQNWNDQLVQDNWADFVTIQLDDPKELRTRCGEPIKVLSKALAVPECGTGKAAGYPTAKMSLHFTTSEAWNDIINRHHAPQSNVINDSIVEVTHSLPISHELMGERGGYHNFNCWRCGSGLGLTGCSGCRASFKDDHFRCGWSTPLPRKLVEYIRSTGHKFETDPAIAWSTEHQYWESAQRDTRPGQV